MPHKDQLCPATVYIHQMLWSAHLVEVGFLEQFLETLGGCGQHARPIPQEVQDQAKMGGVPVDEDASLQATTTQTGLRTPMDIAYG